MHPVIFEIFEGLPRGGPGSRESTHRAFRTLGALPTEARILDIGCGPGVQTLHLAEVSDGPISAVDIHPPFIAKLRETAQARGLGDRVTASVGDMADLPFEDGSFDLLWIEGAIFVIGFERGLREWRRLLTPRGGLACTEVAWLRSDPPDELAEFWNTEYPAITSVEQNLATARASGYDIVDHFVLPRADWSENLYAHLGPRLEELRPKYENEPEALATIETCRREMEIFDRFPDWYGYVFFVLRRSD